MSPGYHLSRQERRRRDVANTVSKASAVVRSIRQSLTPSSPPYNRPRHGGRVDCCRASGNRPRRGFGSMAFGGRAAGATKHPRPNADTMPSILTIGMVARGLEAQWEQRLRELGDAEAEMERRRGDNNHAILESPSAKACLHSAAICSACGRRRRQRTATARSCSAPCWRT